MVDLAKNQTHIILVNALIVKDGKILISQRGMEESHLPGKWTIPGGKVDQTPGKVWSVIEKTLRDEVKEEVGLEVEEEVDLVTNATFIRSTGHHVISMVFLCQWKSGEAKPLEDTQKVRWISQNQLEGIDFCPGVKEYIQKGFEVLNRQEKFKNI